MKNYAIFKDNAAGIATLSDAGKQRYIEMQDSKSKDGNALIAQIEMTHAGIVTRNLGFYLPDQMRNGAKTFTKDYNKPVLIGHDADSDPVGRVIKAEYIDTSGEYTMNDSYLKNQMRFADGAKKKSTNEEIADFAQYVMTEYVGKDNYKGLGHIRGTFKITDPKTIEKILDERYLTVSTAMVSDAARCSECGQDWIAEGQCDHERGHVYDSGVPVSLIPGSMSYTHVGIVSEPADPHAAGFSEVQIIKDGVSTELAIPNQETFQDNLSIAANLFAYNDNKLVSLSTEKEVDFIEVKNNIQSIEDSIKKTESNSMDNDKNEATLLDSVTAVLNIYKNGEDEAGNYSASEVTVRKYLEDMDEEKINSMTEKAIAALDSVDATDENTFKDAVVNFVLEHAKEAGFETTDSVEPEVKPEEVVMKKVKVINDKFKLVDGETEYSEKEIEDSVATINTIEDHGLNKKQVTELANILVRGKLEDALYSNNKIEDKEISEQIADYKSWSDSRFTLKDETEATILEKINAILEDDKKISEESFAELTSKDCAGAGKFFPVISHESAAAAEEVLSQAKLADSLRGRILGSIKKIASTLPVVEENDAAFDNDNAECNNDAVITDEALKEEITKLLAQAEERGLDLGINDSSDKDAEIAILSEQLDAAEQENEVLTAQVSEMKDKAFNGLAERVVDAKINSGLVEVNDRAEAIKTHLERSEDSLQDSLKDLMSVDKVVKPSEKQTADLETVEDPTIQDSVETKAENIVEEETEEEKLKKIQDNIEQKRKQAAFNLLAINKGKRFAQSNFQRYTR